MADHTRLPDPGWSEDTSGYWLSAGQGQLSVQQCASCGAHRWRPGPVCYRCVSLEWSWSELPGTGVVFSYTWVDEPAHGMLSHLGEYNISVIELDGCEGDPVRMLGRIVDIDRDQLRCDLLVEVDFEPFDGEVAIPIWRRTA